MAIFHIYVSLLEGSGDSSWVSLDLIGNFSTLGIIYGDISWARCNQLWSKVFYCFPINLDRNLKRFHGDFFLPKHDGFGFPSCGDHKPYTMVGPSHTCWFHHPAWPSKEEPSSQLLDLVSLQGTFCNWILSINAVLLGKSSINGVLSSNPCLIAGEYQSDWPIKTAFIEIQAQNHERQDIHDPCENVVGWTEGAVSGAMDILSVPFLGSSQRLCEFPTQVAVLNDDYGLLLVKWLNHHYSHY